MAVLLFNVTANAYDFEVDGIYYNITSASDLTVEVAGVKSDYSGEMIIPETVVYKSRTLRVTTIGNEVCVENYGITSLKIPNSVTSIGIHAFVCCGNLSSVNIPNSVTTIEQYAFIACEGIEKIKLDCAIIADWFRNKKSIKEIVIGNNVTEIGDYAFYGCTGLADVSMGNSVTEIGDCAFYNCEFESIELPNSVTRIGRSTFRSCDKLTSIYLLGETPPVVGEGCFDEGQFANITLYVPIGSLEAYQSADIWKNFWDIQECNFTGIEDVNIDAPVIEATANGIRAIAVNGKRIAVYGSNGAIVKDVNNYAGEEITLNKGVYIVKVGENAIKVNL